MEQRTRRPTGLKGSWDWLDLASRLPSDPVYVNALATDQQLVTGRCAITGFQVWNTSGTGGQLFLYDGYDASGVHFSRQSIATNAALPTNFPNRGVLLESGLFLHMTNLIITGAFYVVHLWDYPFTPPSE